MCQPIAASELERSTLQAGTLTAIDELDNSGRGTRGEQRGRETGREVSDVFRVESASTAGTFDVRCSRRKESDDPGLTHRHPCQLRRSLR